MSPVAEPRGLSLVQRIVALAVGGIILASLLSVLISLRGPPPVNKPVELSQIVALINGGTRAGRDVPNVIVSVSQTVPVARAGEAADARRATRLAAALGVSDDRVRVYSEDAAGRDRPFWFGNRQGPPPSANPAISGPDGLLDGFTIGIETPQGWQVIQSGLQPLMTAWHWITLLSVLGSMLLLGLIAWRVALAIARPLSRLADAAHTIRIGRVSAPLNITGPPEVRDVAEAMTLMQARLSTQIAERTTILAAIAHDLGTPLSRLAFHIEKLPEAAREKAEAEMLEMRAMIASVIDFARNDPTRMTFVPLDLDALLCGLIPGDVVCNGGPPLMISGDAIALRRLFSNLIENASRYGRDASVRWSAQDADALIEILDSGPGIDAALLPTILDPFVRGEPSRNRDTGGTGLGLAIVRSIAEAHGGSVTLTNRVEGGLCVSVRLPIFHA
jgi:two-component system, OmpR family, sensor kinase